MSYASEILKDISKAEDFNEVFKIVRDLDVNVGITTFDQRLRLVTLVALADKGIKGVASMLSQEYYNHEDFDGDGLCYGHDFVFEKTADLPPALQALTTNIKNGNIKTLLWGDYKKTH